MTSEYEVKLEWEQVDAIVAKEIKDAIEIISHELRNKEFIHPDDEARNLELLPALFLVYDYWAGEHEADKLKKELDYED